MLLDPLFTPTEERLLSNIECLTARSNRIYKTTPAAQGMFLNSLLRTFEIIGEKSE